MKKIKILTSLTTLGVLSTSTAIITTSCSKNTGEITDISVEGQILGDVKADIGDSYTYKAQDFSGLINGSKTSISKIHITSTDPSILTVGWNEENDTYYVTATKQGEAKLNFQVENSDGNKGEVTCDVHVHGFVTK